MSPRTTSGSSVRIAGVFALLLFAGVLSCDRIRGVRADGRPCVLPEAGGPSEEFGRCLRGESYGETAGSADTAMLVCHTCPDTTVRVRMVLAARRGVRSFNPALPNVAPRHGFALARITNIDTLPFTDMGLEAGASAYWWWGKAPEDTAQTSLFRLNAAGGVSATMALRRQHCVLNQQSPDSARWNKDHIDVCPAGLNNNNWWVTCLNGCCSGSESAQ